MQDERLTYARGTKCLDYIFCTTNLLPSVTKCGILPYSEIFDSNHRSIYVNFNTNTLMGGDLACLSATPVRILRARDTKGRAMYVAALSKYLDDHRVLQRLLAVSEASEPATSKRLRQLTAISRAAWHT